MPAQICPYLGLKDDADTALHYPAAGNHCHHARPLQPVATAHQRNFCLSPAHSACPVYQRATTLAPLPAALSAESTLRLGRGWGIAAAILLAVALLAGWLGRGGANSLLGLLGGGGAIPVTGGSGVERTPFRPGAAFTRTPPPDEGLLLAFTPSPNPTRAACPPPPGWGSYVVNPTDSLVRLSVLYNLELEALLAANCLEAAVGVRPGEVLYVPLLATPTNTVNQPPTAVVVILPSPVLPTFTFIPPTQGPARPDPPTQAPATGTATLIPTVPIFTLTPSTAPTLTLSPSNTPGITNTPRPSSTPEPTSPPEPTNTPRPTSPPTPVPSMTPSPTDVPTVTPSPTDEPTVEPSPTDEPTDEPTVQPSPTDEPTAVPTDEPTALPTQQATDPPTQPPTDPPTATIVPATDTPQPTDLPPPEPSATSTQLSTPFPSDTPLPTDFPTAALTQALPATPDVTSTAPTEPPPSDPTDEPNSDPTDRSSPGIILPTGIGDLS